MVITVSCFRACRNKKSIIEVLNTKALWKCSKFHCTVHKRINDTDFPHFLRFTYIFNADCMIHCTVQDRTHIHTKMSKLKSFGLVIKRVHCVKNLMENRFNSTGKSIYFDYFVVQWNPFNDASISRLFESSSITMLALYWGPCRKS